MSQQSIFAKPWVRVVAFWGIVFPIVFVGLPLVKVATGETEFSMSPIWALALWLVSPFVVSIVLKYARR